MPDNFKRLSTPNLEIRFAVCRERKKFKYETASLASLRVHHMLTSALWYYHVYQTIA